MLHRDYENSPVDRTAGCNSAMVHGRILGDVLISLQQYVQTQGLDLMDEINELGLSFGASSQWGRHYVSLIDFSQLLSSLAIKLRDPCIGLSWCSRGGGPRENVLRLAVRYAATPQDGLQLIARFLEMAIDMKKCEVHFEGGETWLSWAFSPILVHQEHLSDGFATEYCRCFREEFGRFGGGPVRVELQRSAPENRGNFIRVLGVPVVFEASGNRLVFSSAAVAQANPRADAGLHDALVELSERRLADRIQRKDFISQVCDLIMQRIEQADINLEWVARELGMSPRVLQRKLAEKGTTFQELYDQMRCQFAGELLKNTDMPISEIAYRLGFSAVGNFTRAAKRWFGMPPKRWRQQQS